MHPRFARTDPGECPICGAAHCSCGGDGPIEVVQLPNRDAAATAADATFTLAAERDAPAAEGAPPGDGTDGQPFSTATYRGKKPRGRSSRP